MNKHIVHIVLVVLAVLAGLYAVNLGIVAHTYPEASFFLLLAILLEVTAHVVAT